MRRYNVAILISKPFYYHTSFFDLLKSNPEINLTVHYSLNKKLLSNSKCDLFLVYGWNRFTNWFVFAFCILRGIPIALRGESALSQELLKTGVGQSFKKIVLKKLFKKISALLYIGKENKAFYKYYDVPDEKLFFTPYSVDNDKFVGISKSLLLTRDKAREEFGIKQDDVVILFVGKLIEKKRPMDLLKAYYDLVKSNSRVHLMFVGDGILRKKLEEYIKTNNIKNVHFVGFVNQDEITKYYSIADIFVLPSGLGETWGMVVNEAMCFGLPIIVSDLVGSGTDLVRGGQNGYIFKTANIEELTNSLRLLISDKSKRVLFRWRSLELIKEYSYNNDIYAVLLILRNAK